MESRTVTIPPSDCCITPELSKALTQSLFAGLRYGRNRMAVFIANSDESGTEDPRGEFLVAGYIAEKDYWGDFAEKWQRKVLDGPPLIPYLHMNEIRRESWRKQYHLSSADAQRRVSEAVLLLSDAQRPSAGSSVILRADLQDIVQGKSKEYRKKLPIGLDEPDYFCFIAYAYNIVITISAEHPEAKKVDFVVSRKGKLTDRLKRFHEELQRFVDPKFKDLVGELIPGTPEDRLPLQAADLLCWHMQRHFAKTLDNEDQRRLNILTTDLHGEPHAWTQENLERFTENLFKRLA